MIYKIREPDMLEHAYTKLIQARPDQRRDCVMDRDWHARTLCQRADLAVKWAFDCVRLGHIRYTTRQAK